jgi:transmembrane sensor
MEHRPTDPAKQSDSSETDPPDERCATEWHTACANALSRTSESESTRFDRLRRFFAGTGGALVVMALLTTGVSTSDSRSVETYVADVGELKPITLADGSVVTLNTDTILRLRKESNVLHFEVLRGEVLFTMAPTHERHLLVSAGDLSITEAGTTFSVRIVDEGGVRVTVESGAVFLVSAHIPRTLVYGNQQVAASHRGPLEVLHTAYLTRDQVRDQLAWRSGAVVFHCASVAEAAQEFSRYNRKVRIEVHGVPSSVRIGGEFVATDPLPFVQSVVFLYPDVKLQIDKSKPDRQILRLTGIPPNGFSHATQHPAERECQSPTDGRL